MTKPTILLAVTSPLACNFYKDSLGQLRLAGFDITLLSSPGDNSMKVSAAAGVSNIVVSMNREIAPLHDLVSLWKLYRTIRRVCPVIVDASTPKAGLLTGVAAWLARVPCRVYTLRGLRMETATGAKRGLLWLSERVSCWCAHRVVCVGPSLQQRALELGVVSVDKTVVLGKGSGGVDVRRFSPARRASGDMEELRARLGIAADAPVVGFVGRFVRDKGIRQLTEAFQQLQQERPALRLLLVGDFEEGDPIEPEVRRVIGASVAIVRTGFVADTAPYYALMDVLALPTYREGFPGVPLEAQASGVPVVTTTATGAVDSVVDGETGFLVPVGNSEALAGAIGQLLDDPQLRSRMGLAGRARMERDFRPEEIWDAQVQLYRELMQSNLSLPEMRFQEYGAPGIAYSKTRDGWDKRLLDLLLAGVGLLLVAPMLIVLAIVVRVFLGSPVFFRQQRPGLNGRLFMLLKFRTMTDARDEHGQFLPDAERLTAVGRFLRSSSLDELPELINVIRGEMSLVGPRPLLAKYLKRYSTEQLRRHEVKSGITGWAQIHGRNALSWDQRFELDLWYVDHRSLWLDVKILALTLWTIIKREGISQPGHATMPEFRGAPRSENGNS